MTVDFETIEIRTVQPGTVIIDADTNRSIVVEPGYCVLSKPDRVIYAVEGDVPALTAQLSVAA